MKLKSNFEFEPTFATLEEAYGCSYDKEQRDILRLGFENGVDIHKYANPKLDWPHMRVMRYMRKVLQLNIDINKCYVNGDLDIHEFILLLNTCANEGLIEQLTYVDIWSLENYPYREDIVI